MRSITAKSRSLAARIDVVALWISGAAIVVICLTTVVDSISRATGAGSVPIIYDLNLTLLVVLVFASLGYVQVTEQNPEFTLVANKLPKRVSTIMRVIGLALGLLLIGWVTYESFDVWYQSLISGEARMGIAQLPVWPARLAVAIGFLWLGIAIIRSILHIKQRDTDSVVEDPAERPL